MRVSAIFLILLTCSCSERETRLPPLPRKPVFHSYLRWGAKPTELNVMVELASPYLLIITNHERFQITDLKGLLTITEIGKTDTLLSCRMPYFMRGDGARRGSESIQLQKACGYVPSGNERFVQFSVTAREGWVNTEIRERPKR